MTNTLPNEPMKTYSQTIEHLVKNGQTDWYGGEENLVPDEIPIASEDQQAIQMIAFVFGKDDKQVRKDVISAAETEVTGTLFNEAEVTSAIAHIIHLEDNPPSGD
ncbi:hypothetical protein B0G81_3953 [Paraburkholderia sp. BL6665CI2N2]|uniref:hypothetical protein n=1 Tax=Paraburkholderia sp. BL6665CI2N2 TaxID=1938806 RepID=UPI0010659D33|nr:hypothetical protein [Paraburkholderia sp. BL6665CI2N2]TDY23571.1 hypothetical protein B0G81_3953 [Paraburkholderia sp. BL6665CI2N2]